MTLVCAHAAFAVVAVPTGFADELVVGGLSEPTAMAWLPDGRLLVAERVSAKIRLVVGGVLEPDPIFTVPEVEALQTEEGLLGLAVDPAFPDRPYVYLYFTHAGTQTSFLVMYTLTGDLTGGGPGLSVDPGSRYAILTDMLNASFNHNGGGLHFGPDGRLYLGLGDDTFPCEIRVGNELAGALLRLDVSALPQPDAGPPDKSILVPADNPFVLSGDANVRLMAARGLRNPFSFHIDPLTGRVFIADVGLRDFEEINLLEASNPGPDFGWPWYEGPAPLTICINQFP
ncbi:MAG: PQQ-dependent sugar dehydrogenase, partial [Candidatus Binatia bacterium]